MDGDTCGRGFGEPSILNLNLNLSSFRSITIVEEEKTELHIIDEGNAHIYVGNW